MASPDKTPPRTFLVGLAVARDAGRVSAEFYRSVESIAEQLEDEQARVRELTEALEAANAKLAVCTCLENQAGFCGH